MVYGVNGHSWMITVQTAIRQRSESKKTSREVASIKDNFSFNLTPDSKVIGFRRDDILTFKANRKSSFRVISEQQDVESGGG